MAARPRRLSRKHKTDRRLIFDQRGGQLVRWTLRAASRAPGPSGRHRCRALLNRSDLFGQRATMNKSCRR